MAFLFTSESVSEGHPDKVSDQISDAILDEMIAQDPESRVACETFATTGIITVMGEITTKAKIDVQKIVRETVAEIGYDRAKYGFDSVRVGFRRFLPVERMLQHRTRAVVGVSNYDTRNMAAIKSDLPLREEC